MDFETLEPTTRPSIGRFDWQAPTALLPGARAVMALVDRDCRWPMGRVDDDTFHFCGARRVRGSYCGQHYAASRMEGSR